jgi:hypothetical protein
MTLLWENRDTAWYQIEEMTRIERIGGEHSAPAAFDCRQMNDEKLSSVQFVTFRIGAEARASLLTGAPVDVEVDHPAYRARATVAAETLAELRADLQALWGHPPRPLLDYQRRCHHLESPAGKCCHCSESPSASTVIARSGRGPRRGNLTIRGRLLPPWWSEATEWGKQSPPSGADCFVARPACGGPGASQ